MTIQSPGFLNLTGVRKSPYIGQSEASECGLACIAMVASFHGYQTDLGNLRQRFALSLKGATLKQLMQIAETIGFNTRPLRGDVDDLQHLTLPAILHWDLNHFVVLTKIKSGIKGRRYHVHDPASGVLVINEDEVSRRFTGVVLELLKSGSFQPQVQKNSLRISQLWSSIDGLGSSLTLIFALSLVMQFVSLAAPFYMQIALDTVAPSFDKQLLKMLALGFAGLVLINFVAIWTRSLVLLTLNNSLSYQVIVNLFRHLVRLPLPWFEKRHIGDIISRFGSTQPITNLLSQGLITSVIDGLMALVTLALMFVFSPTLSLVAIAALLLYIGLRLAYLQAMRIRNTNFITTNALENSAFIETVRGIAAIKAFGQEGNRQRLWQKKKAEAINASIKLGRLSAGFDATNHLIIGLENVLFVYLAISMVLDTKLTVGMVFAYQAYKQQFVGAGTRLVEQAINYNLLGVHLGRISDIALSKSENLTLTDAAPCAESNRRSPSIELRNVRFSYGVGEPEILRGINLRIESGQSVTMIGPSGGGKTTLLKVMMGLLKPTHGKVLIDGQPIEAYGLSRWRAEIGSVAQDDQLFAGSVAENIAFFDAAPDMARIDSVCELACIKADIEQLPMRYLSLVGDMGSVFSGGQKQRILLARALYSDPTVLMIDEGTANLDPQVETKLVSSLNALNKTLIAIAHRPAMVAAASRKIAVIEGMTQEVNRTTQQDDTDQLGPESATMAY